MLLFPTAHFVSDAFADAGLPPTSTGAVEDKEPAASVVHIRIQKRNTRKSVTTVQGINPKFDCKKIIKHFKSEFCCNGVVVIDPLMGSVIQLQGDQRENAATFLMKNGLAKKRHIQVHGF
jgi:translation initiation factor 1